jgi:hypothetical protein
MWQFRQTTLRPRLDTANRAVKRKDHRDARDLGSAVARQDEPSF